ncbi:MAG: TetR/AcrR family transcriptional regulator, partial [Anaerolineales bacterium]
MNRDEILEAAVQIFSQKGFHASSMKDIANAVDLQKASLYHHVSSKQEILALLLDQSLDILIDQMKEISLLDFP